jgi:hypothetical protein
MLELAYVSLNVLMLGWLASWVGTLPLCIQQDGLSSQCGQVKCKSPSTHVQWQCPGACMCTAALLLGAEQRCYTVMDVAQGHECCSIRLMQGLVMSALQQVILCTHSLAMHPGRMLATFALALALLCRTHLVHALQDAAQLLGFCVIGQS